MRHFIKLISIITIAVFLTGCYAYGGGHAYGDRGYKYEYEHHEYDEDGGTSVRIEYDNRRHGYRDSYRESRYYHRPYRSNRNGFRRECWDHILKEHYYC